jgi:hypothetical protein
VPANEEGVILRWRHPFPCDCLRLAGSRSLALPFASRPP